MIGGMTNTADQTDPRAKWRTLPDRIPPEQWVTERDDEPVPGSVRAFENRRDRWEAQKIIEWGAG